MLSIPCLTSPLMLLITSAMPTAIFLAIDPAVSNEPSLIIPLLWLANCCAVLFIEAMVLFKRSEELVPVNSVRLLLILSETDFISSSVDWLLTCALALSEKQRTITRTRRPENMLIRNLIMSRRGYVFIRLRVKIDIIAQSILVNMRMIFIDSEMWKAQQVAYVKDSQKTVQSFFYFLNFLRHSLRFLTYNEWCLRHLL